MFLTGKIKGKNKKDRGTLYSSVFIFEILALFKLDIGEDEFDIAVTIIGIYLRLICNIEELNVLQLLGPFSEPEADTAD